ncbi:MAG TPA: hypothetical protein VFV01_16790, partial [Spirillospora sp.]|nr:hypothetical protein [Spirillospora sp.]
MSEQRPNASGRAGRDAAHDEPSLDWLDELKSDADDPELQPVDPSVTQAFEAILEEDRSNAAAASPGTSGIPGVPGAPGGPAGAAGEPPAPVPPSASPGPQGPFTGPLPVLNDDQAAGRTLPAPPAAPVGPAGPAVPSDDLARALAEEGVAVPLPPHADPTLTAPDLGEYAAFPPPPAAPQRVAGPATGPLPAVGSGTGPQPAVGPQGPSGAWPGPGTSPQPAAGPGTGPLPAVNPHTGPLPP